MRNLKRRFKRFTAIALAVLMVVTTVDLSTFAVSAAGEGSGTYCEHHTEHTPECGYTEGIEGSPCTHEHGEECYSEVTVCVHGHDESCGYVEGVEDSCTHICSLENGCITSALNCTHEHDEECGYQAAVEGTPCIYVCEECANASNAGSDTVSGNEVSDETTECTCETDDPAFHATNCPAYIAPENPQCYCAEKCTDDTLNVWCDVCGMQGVSACQGEDTAVAYEIVANGICGAEGNESSVTWSLDSDGTLTISGSGAMADYEQVETYPIHYTTPWHDTDNDGEYQNSNIKKVVVEEGITHIGNAAFRDFTELTSISIPNTVKSIGYRSVSYCWKLESLVIPDSVTSIGKEAFDYNVMLTSVTIGNNVESIGAYAFSYAGVSAGSTFTITLPKSVTSIDSKAFSEIYKGATIRYSCSYNAGNGYSAESTKATLEKYHLCEYSSSGNEINCSGCTCGEYSSSTATLSLSSDEPIYYTGEEIKPAVTVTYPDGWGGDKIEPNESNCTYSDNINAGAATCTFKYAEGVEASLDFTIEKAATVITAAPTPIADLVYGGTAQNLINAGTTTDGEMQYSLDGTNYSSAIPTGTDAGEYTVWYKVVGDENHNDTEPASIEVTIAKAEITSITDFGVVAPVAGETPQSSVAAGTGYTAEISWQPDDTSYAPNTVYTATVILTADTNHSFADSITVSGWDKSVDADRLVFTKEFDATGKLKCDVIVPTASILTYNGSAQELVTAGTVPDGCEMQYKLGDDGTFSAEIPTATDVNTYKVYWKVVGNDTYNDIDNGDYVEVTINKATPTLDMFTATPSSELVYDGTEKSIIVTTDKEGMGTFTVSYVSITDGTQPVQPVEAGYYVVLLHIEEGDNYIADDTLSFVPFEIRKADSVITAAPTPIADLVYGGTALNLINAGTATGGEMQYSLDGTNYSSAIPTGTDAGEYTVWYKVVGDKNHNDTEPASIEVTIAPKSITVTADNASKTYGEADPKFTYTATGLEVNDTLTGTLSRETGENVGTYAITQGTLANPNYEITFVEGTFTINKATPPALTIPTATSITYGEKLSASTLSDGWAWVDGTIVPDAYTDCNAYIEVDDSNYDYTSVYGYDSANHRVVRDITVIINRATLTITANSYTIKVGSALPTYDYTVTGLVGDDTLPVDVTISCSATDSNTVGTYPITISGVVSDAPLASHYVINYVNGTLTISEKDIQEITAEDITLTYGDADATISVTGANTSLSYEVIEDSKENGDVVTVDADGKVHIENAGTATIRITASSSDTYAEATCEITVSVEKANLTITFVEASDKIYDGSKKIKITAFVLNGIVNGDDVSVRLTDIGELYGTLESEHVGDYTSVQLPDENFVLTGADADNYLLFVPEFATTNVTIEKAPIVADRVLVTLDAIERPYPNMPLPGTVYVASDLRYSISISWDPADEEAGYNTVYTAKAYLTAEPNYTFAQDISLEDWEVVSNTGAVLVVKRTFEATDKACIVAIDSFGWWELEKLYENTEDVIADLPDTILVCTETDPDGLEMPITWSCESYDNSYEAENIFIWTIVPEAYADYDTNGFELSGELLVINPIDPTEQFVRRMYEHFLGREADEEGLLTWGTYLRDGEMDAATVVEKFVLSDEFVNSEIGDEEYVYLLYNAILEREPEADGFTFWMNALEAGMTRQEVLAGFTHSVEFDKLCEEYGIIAVFGREEQVSRFVERMYTIVLSRAAEPEGLAYWAAGLLDGSLTGSQMAKGFLYSEEFIGRNTSDEEYIKILYRAFLDREAEEAGLAYWNEKMQQGMSRDEVLGGFIYSVEFSNICAEYGINAGTLE